MFRLTRRSSVRQGRQRSGVRHEAADRYVGHDVHGRGAGAAGRRTSRRGSTRPTRTASCCTTCRSSRSILKGAQIITVKAPGDPQVGQGAMLELEGLVAMPWSMNERSGVAFRANRVEDGRRRAVARRTAGRRRRPRRRPSVMWRRSSVVHVVDELARAQRRERWRVELEALLVGLAWAVWSVRVELVLVLALAALQRAVGGLLGWAARRRGRRVGDGDPAGSAIRAAVAARDARAAGVGAGDDRLGRRGRSVPVSGRVVGLARARGRAARRARAPRAVGRRSRCAARAPRGLPACARGSGGSRSGGMLRGRACWSCAAIRSRTRRRSRGPLQVPRRCRCGSRSRSASTSRARTS